MKAYITKLLILAVPVLALPIFATGCVNEFMFAAQSGWYDPYYSEYGDDVVVENNYYSQPTVIHREVTRTTTTSDYDNRPARRHRQVSVQKPERPASAPDRSFNHRRSGSHAKSRPSAQGVSHRQNKRHAAAGEGRSLRQRQNRQESPKIIPASSRKPAEVKKRPPRTDSDNENANRRHRRGQNSGANS
jgi:hypothetical protein